MRASFAAAVRSISSGMAERAESEVGEAARKLRAEASDAVRRGQLRKALARYRALEDLEPADPQWSCRVADVEARLGEKAEEIEALVRAVERCAAGGLLLRGIAICKRILDLDPRHTRAQERLAALCTAQGAPLAPPPHLGACVPASGPPLAPGAVSEVLLDEVAGGEGEAGVRPLALGPDSGAAALAGSVLPRTALFGDLSPTTFDWVVRAARLVRVREDGVLFREGDPGDALYVVVDGAVVPCAERPARRRLALLQAGEFFGEVALVTDQPRIATVRALVDTTLLALDADAVRALVRREPGLMVVFLRFLRERLLHRLGQTSPLFRPLDPAALRRLAARFRFLAVDDGAELVSQGEPPRRFFVALCGRFEVSARDAAAAHTLAWLETGDVFGEMSLLSGEPAMASVTARGRGFVLALDASAFHAFLASQPALAEGLRAIAAERTRRGDPPPVDVADTLRRHVDLP